jgi:hypothetical protein
MVTTVDAPGTTTLYWDNVWKLHGLPEQLLTDRGTQFALTLIKELLQIIRIKWALTMAYYLQSDRQTECVNQEIEQFLWIFCNHLQDDWVDLPAMAEFSYNNSVHSTTQSSPFMLDTGQNPCMGFEPLEPPSSNETAKEFGT